jgi:exopolysaccharide biosynthesis polyprenyl glycosylphosphotransferase
MSLRVPVSTHQRDEGSPDPPPIAALDATPSTIGAHLTAICKRSSDILVSAILLTLLAPVLVLAMLAIRLDSQGPAIFAQERIGRCGRPFRILKFRTMTHNPGGELIWLRDHDGRVCHKMHNDPRVTRVGRWLRTTSVDELPQLWNILRGDMSLVGPRPELPAIVATYEPWQHERHRVRPGLTGWWQVSGRSDKPMHEHTELDLYYVRNQSLLLDMQILLKTVVVVFKGIGAF